MKRDERITLPGIYRQDEIDEQKELEEYFWGGWIDERVEPEITSWGISAKESCQCGACKRYYDLLAKAKL